MSTMVVGGCGFMGQRCIRRLVSLGEEIVGYDVVIGDNVLQNKLVKYVLGDVTDLNTLIETIKKYKVERIVHLAYMLLTDCEQNPHKAVRINTLGTANIFEAAKLLGVKKVVCASSNSVYGLPEYFENVIPNEDDVPRPTTIYGLCKYYDEKLGTKYRNNFGVDIVFLRFPIAAGPGRKSGLSSWASDFASAPAAGESVTLQVNPSQKLLVIYIDDLVKLISDFALVKQTKHTVYNCPGHQTDISQMVDIVKKYIPDAKIEFASNAKDLPVIHRWDCSRLANEMDFELTPLEESVYKHIQYIRGN